MLDPSKVTALSDFINLVKQSPELLHEPELKFFKDYLESLGATVPAAREDPERLFPESDERPDIVDPKPDLTESEMERMSVLKSEASEAVETGDFKKALMLLTQVVVTGGSSAMVLAKRAEILLKLKRPIAAIADCDAALAINAASGKAFRIRGIAHRKLGNWESAHADLAKAQMIDYDDETEKVKRFVDEMWKKEHAMHAKASTHSAPKASTHAPAPPPFPGMPNMASLMNDPELMTAMANPRIMAALQQMMANPASILQYQNDPEVGPILTKLISKLGGGMF